MLWLAFFITTYSLSMAEFRPVWLSWHTFGTQGSKFACWSINLALYDLNPVSIDIKPVA